MIPYKQLIICLAVLLYALNAHAQRSKAKYHDYFPHGECSPAAFSLAWEGYEKLNAARLLRNPRYLTIVDLTKPSNQQRFFVLDIPAGKRVLSSITAHGVGSDPDSLTIPYRFGNTDGSRMSSIGFYLTGSTYTNHRPDDSLGLCLFGIEQGFNDSAARREIVVHYGATEYTGRVYVNDSGAARSFGCPALPLSTNTRAIRLIREGSCLFIYSDKVKGYVSRSAVLNDRIRLPIIQQGPPPNNCRCRLQPD